MLNKKHYNEEKKVVEVGKEDKRNKTDMDDDVAIKEKEETTIKFEEGEKDKIHQIKKGEQQNRKKNEKKERKERRKENEIHISNVSERG